MRARSEGCRERRRRSNELDLEETVMALELIQIGKYRKQISA